MVQKYTFHVQKREKERDGGGGAVGEAKNTTSCHEMENEKNPKLFGVKNTP